MLIFNNSYKQIRGSFYAQMPTENKPTTQTIIPRVIEEEMKRSYLDYAMSVIIGRALPDVRDGLKPVHRRILYAMHDAGLTHNKPFRKSAFVVGRVIAEFHPHGDQAVYDSMVRMAQDFSMRYMLVNGQGNFGCFTKDTKVLLTDGRKLSFGELVEEHKAGKKNYTYTVNKLGNIAIVPIEHPRLTKKNTEIMKVILDTNEEIRCTLNHKFMLRNGAYTEAQYLKSGDSLMPINPTKFYNELSFVELSTMQEALNLVPPINHKVNEIVFLNQLEDVYDLTVNTTHNFALAAGIFVHNSIDGDSAAAFRYTEARLTALSEELLEDIKKETVDFDPNFDGSSKEPHVLPSKFPNLLLNGSTGIAVGMATNIPPHNLKELHGAVIAQIDNPAITMEELIAHIPAPDFPTGGLICGRNGVVNAYSTGRGKITVRSKTSIEEVKGRQAIIVHEIPYMVNKAEMIKHIADLVRDKVINDIHDLRDESDRDGMRVVIELKQNANSDFVLSQLFAHSRMQTSIGLNFVALVGNQPKTLTLKELIHHFIVHRIEVVRRRTAYDLGVAKDRAHILEGLIIALANIDKVVALIKNSKKVDDARTLLISTFRLTEKQANAILDMRLSRLTTLETEKIKEEHKELLSIILDLESILASETKIKNIIKKELSELAEKFGDARRSQVINEETSELNMEDLVAEGQCVITISHSGYIKRLPTETYTAQRRGGKGITATKTDEQDSVSSVFVAHTHSYMLFFTNKGKVHWLKVYNIPEGSRISKGKAIVNLIELEEGETVSAYVPVQTFDPDKYVMLCTASGIIKKTELSQFANPRRGGILAVDLLEGDALISAKLTDGKKEIIIATKQGVAARFSEDDVRAMGRQAAGVRGIKLDDQDKVIAMITVNEGDDLLTITENGFGKRTALSEYRLINRGGKGVINIICSERNGNVVSVSTVKGTEEFMVISQNGIALRIPVKDISSIGRNTQGVRIMRLEEGDKVVDAAIVVSDEAEPK